MTGRAGHLDRTRLFRFFTVGASAALLFFCLSWLLVSIGFRPFAGSILAYAIAFLLAYAGQHGWTFEGRHRHGSALPRYLTLQIGCAALSGLVAHVAVEGFGFSPLAMSIVTTLAVSAASYALSSLWVFPQRG